METNEIGQFEFWKMENGFIPIKITLKFKPSWWYRFKMRLMGVVWVEFKSIL